MPAVIRSTISASRNDSSGSLRSIRWTSVPSAANIDAYSQPITPPPRTAIEAGSRSISRIESESCTSGSSNGIPGGRNGLDPVAIKIASAASDPIAGSPVTATVVASTSRAEPCTSST